MPKNYMTSLPQTTDTKKGFIKTVDSPRVPAMDYRSGFRDVAGAIDNTNKFLGDYTKMKYEGFQADLDRLELQHLHEMVDAKDPCELEAINEKWNKEYDNALKDDFWAKSYYKSNYYNRWKDRNQEAQQKLYYRKQHEFAEICANSTLNKLSETAALLDNPEDIAQYLRNGEAMLANTEHLTAENKYKLMTNFYKDTVSRLYNADPNKAVAWLDYAGESYDQYGLDKEEVRTKAKNYNKAKKREAQLEQERALRMKDRADKSMATQLKARILQNPENAEAIIDEAANLDDSVYVNVADWYRKGIGKKTAKQQSPYLDAFIQAEDKDQYLKDHPEAISDSAYRAGVNFYYEKLGKKAQTGEAKERENSLLQGMKAAAEEGQEEYEEYVEDNFADISMFDKTRSARNDLNKHFGIKEDNYVDTYLNSINAREDWDLDDLKAERVRVGKDPLLSPADKNKVYSRIDTLESKVTSALNKEEAKEAKEEAAEIKEQERIRKEESGQALNSIYSELTNGSEKAQEVYLANLSKLNTSDRGKAIKEINSLIRTENKGDVAAQKEAKKQMQAQTFRTLNNQINTGVLSDPQIISDFADKGEITHKDAARLQNKLYERNQKNATQLGKDLIEKDKVLINTNAMNGVPTNREDIKSDDPSVIAMLNKMNYKINNDNYEKQLASVKDDMWQNRNPSEEQVADYIDSLVALNVNGDKSPQDDVMGVLQKIQQRDSSNVKTLRDRLLQQMGSPLFGKDYNAYEVQKRNAAWEKLYSLIENNKAYDINAIANEYRPTKEEYYLQNKDKDEIYYGLVAQKDSLFVNVKETGESEYGKETRNTVDLLSNATFNQLDDYIQNLENNQKNLTDKQYQDLYKPVATYMSEIVRRAGKYDTIEAYAMKRVIREFGGGKTDNPTLIYETYRDVINTLELNGAERSKTVGWIFGTTKKDVDKVIDEKLKTSQQLKGYVER